MASRILHMDSDCVIVNKLPGESTEGTPAGGNMADLPAGLAGLFPQAAPVAVHRIDVPVTGCALFALTKNALSFLSTAFAAPPEASAVEKRYWAIAEKPGRAATVAASGELVHWIDFDSAKNKSFAHGRPGWNRKKAVLRYSLAGEGKNYLFFEVELVTGRHHQIRAQFAAAGLHIKGDLKYGAKRSEKAGGIRLHARSLSIPSPCGTGRISRIAPPPVMDNLWAAFPAPFAEPVHKS